MERETVTVIVPTFNRAHYLRECLDSLLAQSLPADEIIVVDDGSEDDTPAVAASFGSRILYLRKENGGKPRAVNFALERCTGSLIWLFDDDDVALPEAIESRVSALTQVPEADFVYSPHYLGTDGPDRRIRRGRLYVPPTPSVEHFFLELMCGCFFHLNSALVRRSLYAAAGPFDPALKAGEDYDMQIRLARLGRPAFSSEPSFVFRQHSGLRGDRGSRYSAEERARVFRRYSAQLGRKIRASVPTGEFLVPSQQREPTGANLKAALLNRVRVMANLGCIPELFDDLDKLLAEFGTLNAAELEIIGLAMCTGWAYESAADDRPLLRSRVRELRMRQGGLQVCQRIALAFWKMAVGYPGTYRQRLNRVRSAISVRYCGSNQ